MTRQVLLAALSAAISLLSLLAGSGIGKAYDLYPITSMVVSVIFLLFVVGRTLSDGYVRRRELFLTLALVAVIVVWPAVCGNKLQGAQYGWLLALPYVIGLIPLSQKDIRTICLSCGMVGLAVVASRVFLNVFGNWNRNDIAMAGFFGCAVCSVAPWETWGQKIFHKILLMVMAVLILQLDSRSCLIGTLVLALFSLGILKKGIFSRKRWLRWVVLFTPIAVVIITVLFQNSQIFDSINAWSTQYFSKPVFNGRNLIWEEGLRLVKETPWLGKGYINNGYWHNCALSALTAFGIVGYYVWVAYFENIMVDTMRFQRDTCLQYSIVAFLTIMVQQSFELGLISTTGSMLPYLILGIMLGRMRYLKKQTK